MVLQHSKQEFLPGNIYIFRLAVSGLSWAARAVWTNPTTNTTEWHRQTKPDNTPLLRVPRRDKASRCDSNGPTASSRRLRTSEIPAQTATQAPLEEIHACSLRTPSTPCLDKQHNCILKTECKPPVSLQTLLLRPAHAPCLRLCTWLAWPTFSAHLEPRTLLLPRWCP